MQRVAKALAPNKPIPSRVLLGMAMNETQQAFIRETFVTHSNAVGKDEAGDWLIVGNKHQWLAEAAARKAAEEKVREDAIRERMEVK